MKKMQMPISSHSTMTLKTKILTNMKKKSLNPATMMLALLLFSNSFQILAEQSSFRRTSFRTLNSRIWL